mgnify:CR=1 FL=1
MIDNSTKDQKIALIATLEGILSELDDQQYFLPALKIVEALEHLKSPDELAPPDDG